MFCLRPKQDEESRASPLTALSLSTGIQGVQQSHVTSNKMQPTRFAYTRNRENSYESQESRMIIKRQRSLDGAALTIGSGSSSGQQKPIGVDHPMEPMRSASFGAGSRVCRGEFSGNKSYPIANISGVGDASDVRGADKASSFSHVVHGLGNENGNKTRAYRRAGMGSGSDVNDVNKTRPHPKSVNGLSGEHGNKSEKIRHRMIKNRESAARSRARKQAQEVQQQLENRALKKENDILKGVVRFLLAIIRTKHMKMPTMSRSYSAPF